MFSVLLGSRKPSCLPSVSWKYSMVIIQGNFRKSTTCDSLLFRSYCVVSISKNQTVWKLTESPGKGARLGSIAYGNTVKQSGTSGTKHPERQSLFVC